MEKCSSRLECSKGRNEDLAHECSHAEIGSQASLSRWCPMGVRVQVSLVALIYFHSSVGSERLPYKQGVIGSNPIGSTNLPPQWCNGSTRDCDSLSSGSNLGWRTKIKKNSIKIVIVYPLFYDKVFLLLQGGLRQLSQSCRDGHGMSENVTPAR